MAIFTEPDPRSPGAQRFPGAYTPGDLTTDRSAEYGGPATRTGVVSFTPQRQPGADGRAGMDERPPSLDDIVGPAPAIGETRP